MASRYKPQAINNIYIDATNQVVGRLASKVAKLALLGNNVYIVNAEKAVVTGKKETVLEEWKHKILERGDWYKGPFYPKRPDRILKRIIRGMLPKNWRGRVAYSRIKVFIGIPEELKNKEFIRFEDADILNKLKNSKRKVWYVKLEDISKAIGAKIS